MSDIKRVLVTGANGTVGGFVVGHLLERGYHVIATDMCPVSSMTNCWTDYWQKCAKTSCREQLSLCQRDLSDPKNTETLMEFAGTCDAVIHCAALIDVAMPYKALKGANVDAPPNLYRELKKIGGKIFVFISSGSIYGNAPLLTETTSVKPNSPYEQTKVDAEKLLMAERAAIGGPKLAILRPSLIYGPKNRFLAANYLASAVIFAELLGKRLPMFHSGPKTNFVHAEDVARAAIFLMENAREERINNDCIFNICDDSPLGFGDQLRIIAEACGYSSLPIRLPIPSGHFLGRFHRIYNSPVFLKALNAVLQGIWKWVAWAYKLEKGFTPDISPAMTPFFGQDTIFSNEKIKRLGFKLLHPDFGQGIKTVVPWYKSHRWIP